MRTVQLTVEQLEDMVAAHDGDLLQALQSLAQDHGQNLTDVQKLEAWLLQQKENPCSCAKCLAITASHYLQTYLTAGRTEEQARACMTYMSDVEEAIKAHDDILKNRIIHAFAATMEQV